MVIIQRRLQEAGEGHEWDTYVRLNVHRVRKTGLPTGRESYGDGVPIVVDGVTSIQGARESRLQGEVGQVSEWFQTPCEVREMLL